MQLLAALGGGAFVLVSLVLSTRLLLLASRTRQLPELLVGLVLLLLGGVGYPLSTAGRFLDPSSALAFALFVTSIVAKVPLARLVRELWPFLWAHLAVLVLLSLFPILSAGLPNALGYR